MESLNTIYKRMTEYNTAHCYIESDGYGNVKIIYPMDERISCKNLIKELESTKSIEELKNNKEYQRCKKMQDYYSKW